MGSHAHVDVVLSVQLGGRYDAMMVSTYGHIGCHSVRPVFLPIYRHAGLSPLVPGENDIDQLGKMTQVPF